MPEFLNKICELHSIHGYNKTNQFMSSSEKKMPSSVTVNPDFLKRLNCTIVFHPQMYKNVKLPKFMFPYSRIKNVIMNRHNLYFLNHDQKYNHIILSDIDLNHHIFPILSEASSLLLNVWIISSIFHIQFGKD